MPTARVHFNVKESERSTRERERERERERKNHLVRVTNNSLSFVMLRVKGLTLRTSGVNFARGELERRFLGNFYRYSK